MASTRPIALLTGLGRRVGIASGIATRLARDGWDIAFSYNAAYDESVNSGADEVDAMASDLRVLGARTVAIESDLAFPDSAELVFDKAERLGPVTALILSHAHSTNASILSTTVESFDRHFAVNARASWLLIREFALRFAAETRDGMPGRIVALTSDAVIDEVAYGASKAALDRIVLAAAHEFGARGITANLINPGPIDTGWMTADVREWVQQSTPARRLGQPADTAALVSFLLSADGGWVNGQLLKSDGGFSALK